MIAIPTPDRVLHHAVADHVQHAVDARLVRLIAQVANRCPSLRLR